MDNLQPLLLMPLPTTNPLLCFPLPLQKLLLLDPTFAQIHKEQQKQERRQTQPEQEVKRRAVVLGWAGVDDGRRDKRADKRASLTDDAEQREEEELFAAGCHFGDHDLTVAVPGADK